MAQGLKGSSRYPQGQATSRKCGDDLRHEENYKQGIVALGGSRETLNPLANRGALEGSIHREPRLLFLREQHLFHIF
jgi:hypothetical protein